MTSDRELWKPSVLEAPRASTLKPDPTNLQLPRLLPRRVPWFGAFGKMLSEGCPVEPSSLTSTSISESALYLATYRLIRPSMRVCVTEGKEVSMCVCVREYV